MEGIAEFAAAVVAVSATGALAPGPLMAAGVALGVRGGARAGLSLAAGHAAVELPLVLALGAGIAPLAGAGDAGRIVSAAGAAGLFAFAAIHARQAIMRRGGGHGARGSSARGALAVGAALSAANPFFWAWWATVGVKLAADSSSLLGPWGPPALFALHIPMDIAWLGAVAALAARGSAIMGARGRLAMDVALVAAMAAIGVAFALEAAA